MSDEIRSLFKRAAASPDGAVDKVEVSRRARRVRLVNRTVASFSFLSIAAITWFVVGAIGTDSPSGNGKAPPVPGTSPTNASGGEGGYSFSNLQVREEDSGTDAAIAFDYEWTGLDFPGVRECTFTVYGPNGETVGREVERMGFTQPSGSSSFEYSLKIHGEAASVDIDCGERLNDPDGSYTFSNIEVTVPDVDRPMEVLIAFDSRWTGDSPETGVASCDFSVFDESDELMLRELDLTYGTDAVHASSQLAFDLDEPASRDPGSASIECEPLR